MKEVFIVSAVRTPMGSFLGSLSNVPAPQLGATAIKGALAKINLDPKEVQEVYMGNVLQAGEGQAPARQAALGAGLSKETPCTTINKVCASGMKAVMMATQAIKAGDADVVVAGGMENMSLVPHYYNARQAVKLGDVKMQDGMVLDGLTDVYNKVHMGVCAEKCASEYGFSREAQDKFAVQSYQRAASAWKEGKFSDEIVPVEIPQRKGEPILFTEDEEYKNVNFDRIPTLPTVFQRENGTVTAANASTLNDGASALILMSKEKMEELGLKPLAKIIGYADAAQEPEWFTTAPAKALPKALDKAEVSLSEVDFFEFNEAFSVVGLANNKILGLDESKVNVNGGAVALGHPLGSSGSRILVTLINVLKQNNGKIGAAAICNGGGGASALVIENC
ncbi:acetyl-CoA C-acyltransferase [Riemerella anatipestifer]|uniref:acetyl-CoA C-acetyltransferase n=1 Tax=Riemerella anatipestifer (strain ATCC 11845 / DSM 15868 / JCM 9532 / NCTC 11014) TaxID=693978 RepID=E4TBM8_RIEAD|nr:acetyl-CoA C-acyltransferase [Riemerella anatipestifer]ADQ81857.1 acetyl-CoA acetyltransferase [Riemerella anatipestifer ATCC 11845 = DSM 15868]ADZ12642.1 Acetyl-CoA acetyltransferase [Riemerella anatipestifer RA-GD]AFD55868.1 acetyl-CoA acetyltransferase [Riemerella anatipestifer ATCC 11845 = DSM 15868]AGC40229.1 Acetyl-CoA acetyltransferase [Riemerella anatipestifer RA-CH-2]AKP69094.1 acetyl-CoA acetyltransferase [Riemerella anatipestifer]